MLETILGDFRDGVTGSSWIELQEAFGLNYSIMSDLG